jgi:hypothetical protein
MLKLKNKKNIFKIIQSKWNQLEDPEREWTQLENNTY